MFSAAPVPPHWRTVSSNPRACTDAPRTGAPIPKGAPSGEGASERRGARRASAVGAEALGGRHEWRAR
eukprot:7378105-Prymnesium_polylepis.1